MIFFTQHNWEVKEHRVIYLDVPTSDSFRLRSPEDVSKDSSSDNQEKNPHALGSSNWWLEENRRELQRSDAVLDDYEANHQNYFVKNALDIKMRCENNFDIVYDKIQGLPDGPAKNEWQNLNDIYESRYDNAAERYTGIWKSSSLSRAC